jgi:hypothetical protein
MKNARNNPLPTNFETFFSKFLKIKIGSNRKNPVTLLSVHLKGAQV